MKLNTLQIRNHPILGDISLDFMNPKTGEPFSIVAFVGENGCGKTTLLNELFNYSKSDFVVSKQRSITFAGEKDFDALFLRQDTLYTESMNDVYKLITGRELLTTRGDEPTGGQNILGLRRNVPVNTPSQAEGILSAFDDERLKELFVSGKLDKIIPGGEVSRSINGVVPELDFSMLSSGQIEILLKLRMLKNLRVGTDMILLDEPETSLHPRWQQIVVGVIASMIKESEGESPQLFVATHSERVLESLIGKGDTLIVRLFRKDGKISAIPIDLMGLLLPKPTFAELDYVIFGMASYDYHDQLLSRFMENKGVFAMSDADRAIREDPRCIKPDHRKTWRYTSHGKEQNFRTLPLYIRNYFHHPREGAEPTAEELDRSINLLRELVKDPDPLV
ncbi:MAG: AAA family ATPase [Bacilli bacterium]|nr:AAA family ATPase [Bacilli bacterium]